MTKYVPVRITYLNSRRREVTVFGVYAPPTIRVGEKMYFRSLSNKNELIQTIDGGNSSRAVGEITEFRYLDTGDFCDED